MRLVIADDSGIFRSGLRLLLEAAGAEVVADAADVPHLLRAIDAHSPDVCVVDLRLPPTFTNEGVEAAREVRARRPGTGVLVLSTYADPVWAERLLRDSAGSAVGYLLKDRVHDAAALLEALGTIAAGGTVMDAEIVTALMGRRRSRPLDELAPREREVLALMAQGRSNSGIGRELHLSPKTVEGHVAAVFAKLGLEAANAGRDHNRRVLAVLTYLRNDETR